MTLAPQRRPVDQHRIDPIVRAVASASAHRDQPKPSNPRDSSIDLVRAASLIVVVALHSMMVGVSITSSGPLFENAFDGTTWFAPVSWVVQVMPLFFIAGGFSSYIAWTRADARGESPASFVAARLRRLLIPAAVVLSAVSVTLGILMLTGVSPELVVIAGFRISQPLWFLGVYLLCQALAPLAVRAHRRHPIVSLAIVGGAAVGIDATRMSTGIEVIGYLNLALVWLFMQQLGFWLADGRIGSLAPSTRWVLASATFTALIVATSVGPYSNDMYVNLNPPTTVLMGLGVLQLFLLSLAQPTLRRWAARPSIGAAANAIGSRAMTIYLWHMPVLIGLAGAAVLLVPAMGLELPTPGSDSWWATRPAWLVLSISVIAAVTLLTSWFERGSRLGSRVGASTGRVIAGSIIGVASVGVIFVLGLSAVVAALSAVLMVLALRIATRKRQVR